MKEIDNDMLNAFRRECVGALEFKKGDIDRLSQEELVTLLYAYYHYFEADPERISQLKAGSLLHDENATHCISGIFRDNDTNPPTIDILITLGGDTSTGAKALGKTIHTAYQNCMAFLQSIRGTYHGNNMCRTEQRLKNLKYSHFRDETHPTNIVFLVCFSPTEKQRETIEKQFKDNPFLDDCVIYADQIEYEIKNTNSAISSVSKASILLDKAENICYNSDGSALLCNIKATSLRMLYQTYAFKGLLSQNLRYFIKMPRVDNAMMGTILGEPHKFWFLNNGITIACESFLVDGNSIELTNFSIINGGQTTHNIGTLDDSSLTLDFDIPCKIISYANKTKENDRLDFLAEISEASNNQKPINAVDAVANRREQRKLKHWLVSDRKMPIFYQTKRGETFNKTLFPESWQRLTTADFGQSLLCFLYQYPGIARSQKSKIFADDILYHQLFDEPFPNFDFIKNLQQLRQVTKNYIKSLQHDKSTKGSACERLASNGELFILSCIGLLVKTYVNQNILKNIDIENLNINELREIFGQSDIAYPFLNPTDAPNFTALQIVIEECVTRLILPAYQKYQKGKTVNDYSNFTKRDTIFHHYVLPHVIYALQEGLFVEKEILDKAFILPSEQNNFDRENYNGKHPAKWSTGNTFAENDLLQQLIEYVNRTKQKGTKKPTKGQLTKLINKRLSTTNHLVRELAFTTKQCDLYGAELLNICKHHWDSEE